MSKFVNLLVDAHNAERYAPCSLCGVAVLIAGHISDAQARWTRCDACLAAAIAEIEARHGR